MSEQNPYRPPDSPPALVANKRGWEWTPRAITTAFAVVAAVIAYLGFVVMLVMSTSQDREAGFLWSANVPVFVLWLFAMFARRNSSHRYGFAAAVVQVGIGSLMLLLKIGDVALVVTVNAGVVAGFVALATACRFTFEPR